jgi:hypothetical protein
VPAEARRGAPVEARKGAPVGAPGDPRRELIGGASESSQEAPPTARRGCRNDAYDIPLDS